MAYIVAIGYIANCILLGGYFIRIQDIKFHFLRALSWLSYSKYTMDALGRNELHNIVWDPRKCSLNRSGGSYCGDT